MDIIDRFSTHLKDVLSHGLIMATETLSPSVEPIHLLFCLSEQKGSVAADTLERFKITPKKLEPFIFVAKEPRLEKTEGAGQTLEKIIPPLSTDAKLALEKAIFIAEEHGHNFVGTEHLLYSLVALKNPIVSSALKTCAVAEKVLLDQISAILKTSAQFPNLDEMEDVAEKIQENFGGNTSASPIFDTKSKQSAKKKSSLEFFAVNLTSPEILKNIDPVIGREEEVWRLIQILSRRTKNNPVLLGDPGVGKTAIVEGLAKKIGEGNVPPAIAGKKIYSLDMGLLIAGTIYRGEFESRLRQVIDEVSNDKNIILFIDEMHNIVGAGSSQGALDAGNILKPALARGLIRCIGATTPGEFKKHIENDAALERRFQPIYVREPSAEETVKILKGVKKSYEEHHNIKITDEATEAAVRMSQKYIANKFLPDKAIDLLDETAAAKRLTLPLNPDEKKLADLRAELQKATEQKETAAEKDNFEEASKWKKEESILNKKIKTEEKKRAKKSSAFAGEIGERDVAAQISRVTGVPAGEILLEEKEKMANLENEMKKHIVGQDEVLTNISRMVQRARLQLSEENRPYCSFLFVGESGVGKTETAVTLAKILYPRSDSLIKLNMSEFNESFGVSKLLGSPAGYVGYREANQFTDKIKSNPHSVILFDEIDKAHKDVTRLLLQMLEDGEITDSTGRKISLKHAIIILTTSLGAEECKRAAFGFGGVGADKSAVKTGLLEKLKDYFTPELVGRLDDVFVFNSLSADDLKTATQLEITRLNDRLKDYETTVESDDETLAWLIDQIPQKEANARRLRKEVRGRLEKLMAEIILSGRIKPRYKLCAEKENLTLR